MYWFLLIPAGSPVSTLLLTKLIVVPERGWPIWTQVPDNSGWEDRRLEYSRTYLPGTIEHGVQQVLPSGYSTTQSIAGPTFEVHTQSTARINTFRLLYEKPGTVHHGEQQDPPSRYSTTGSTAGPACRVQHKTVYSITSSIFPVQHYRE